VDSERYGACNKPNSNTAIQQAYSYEYHTKLAWMLIFLSSLYCTLLTGAVRCAPTVCVSFGLSHYMLY